MEQPSGGHQVIGGPLREPGPVKEATTDEVQTPSGLRVGHVGGRLRPEGGLGEVVRLSCRPMLVGFDGGGRQPRKGRTRVTCVEVVVTDDPGVATCRLHHRGETGRLVTPSALADGQGPG